EILFHSRHREAILAATGGRGIRTPAWCDVIEPRPKRTVRSNETAQRPDGRERGRGWSNRVSPEDVPCAGDIMTAADVHRELDADGEFPTTVLAVGDVMLSGRSRLPIAQFGEDYPFAAVQPLLSHAPIVLANLEGPLARTAK